jgi:hypothetical protein
MRAPPFVLVAMVVLTASCQRPKPLVDGCYYANNKPVFKIAGTKGWMLIPGDVKTFKVERGGNDYVRFVPGLLFEASDKVPLFLRAYPDLPPHSMKVGTSVPTIEMHWEAYGDEDVHLGSPC